MVSKTVKLRGSLFLLLVGILAAAPAWAGSAVIGSVAGSMNATIGGQLVLPDTTILSGDTLQVNDGVAVVAVDNTSRMVFGRQTSASFLRDSNEVTVLMSQGNVSIYHPDEGVPLRVKVGDVSILPAKGFKTLGEVAMAGGTVVITAKEGMLQVEGNGSTQEVVKGKTITVPAKAARAPKPSPAGSVGAVGAGTLLAGGAVAAGGTAAVLSAVSISRANDARDAANAANAMAGGAVSAANAAASAAAAADSDAIAATSAANAANSTAGTAVSAANAATSAASAADSDAIAATSAANAAFSTAVLAGCAIDKVTPSVKGVSPFVPPAGTTCP